MYVLLTEYQQHTVTVLEVTSKQGRVASQNCPIAMKWCKYCIYLNTSAITQLVESVGK